MINFSQTLQKRTSVTAFSQKIACIILSLSFCGQLVLINCLVCVTVNWSIHYYYCSQLIKPVLTGSRGNNKTIAIVVKHLSCLDKLVSVCLSSTEKECKLTRTYGPHFSVTPFDTGTWSLVGVSWCFS